MQPTELPQLCSGLSVLLHRLSTSTEMQGWRSPNFISTYFQPRHFIIGFLGFRHLSWNTPSQWPKQAKRYFPKGVGNPSQHDNQLQWWIPASSLHQFKKRKKRKTKNQHKTTTVRILKVSREALESLGSIPTSSNNNNRDRKSLPLYNCFYWAPALNGLTSGASALPSHRHETGTPPRLQKHSLGFPTAPNWPLAKTPPAHYPAPCLNISVLLLK